jgi:hypothetical protein
MRIGIYGAALILAACGRIGFDAGADNRDGGMSIDGGMGDAAIVDGSIPPDEAFLPITNNIAFVTSITSSVSAVGSPGGASSLCNSLAMAADLPGTYVAWMSSSTEAADQRLGSARGWVRPDGRPFADTISDMAAGRIRFPLRLDEFKSPVALSDGAIVMTGTRTNGTTFSFDQNCSDFSVTSGVNDGMACGTAVGAAGYFTTYYPIFCGGRARLYCLGVDHSAPLKPFPRASGRIAFLSSIWTTGSGVAGADAVCAQDAQAAGLSGAFLALLATSSASAASRFDLNASPWVRPDGVAVASSARALMDGDLDAPIAMTAAGQPNFDPGTLETSSVWTGARSAHAVGDDNCNDWTSNSSGLEAWSGDVVASPLFFFVEGTHSLCNARRPVYCLQQ